ncbi:MAG: O-antigen ligase family protein [Tannerella sp.]|nr:O-antigen ligase family protein [Tannerella sp.]
MALLSEVAIPVAIIKRKERVKFKFADLLLLLFCIAALIITFKHTGRLTNKCLLLIYLMAFYFYLRIFLSGKSKLTAYLLVMFFVFTGLVEAVWGLRQLYGSTASQHNLFKITGSFFNPGPYSGWLAMVFPVALWSVIQEFTGKRTAVRFNRKIPIFNKAIIFNMITFIKNELPVWIKIAAGSVTVLCIISVLPAAMSRASWLAAIGGSVFIGILYGVRNRIFIDYFKLHRKKVFILSAVTVVLFAISMAGLFFLKKDSASGRAFTWKIALQTITEHSTGVGLGNFGASYGDMQAAYFASGAGTECEEYVAEGVEYAFNEYLQICIETGIIPFLMFLALVVFALVSGVRNGNYLPAGALVSLLIFASMSYPFNVLPFAIAFVFLSALCMMENSERKSATKKAYPKFAVWTFLIIVPVAIIRFSTFNSQLYEAYKQWNTTKILYRMNLYEEAVGEYAKQYPYLQDEVKFLFEYAQSLSKTEEYAQSNEILRSAMQISCDPMLYNIMGKNCQALKEYELAEQSLKKAANLVPNRLYPHYLLAKLYHETGLKEKAQMEVNIVLTKPPKVESMAIEEMREELIKLLKE